MRITFLGHAGLFVETRHGSVLCDPWFTPAYFGSWFPFPRNDHLDVTRFGSPDYLYLSHLHLDHYDPAFLSRHVDTSATVLLPQFAVPYQEEALRRLGFTRFERPPHGEAVDLDGLEVALFAMNEPADGPLGDSALIVGDGEVRILNQNDARPGDIAALQRLGPYDGHFLQFSGAIWYPVAYDFPPEEKARLGRTKRANQMERARQYVEWIGAAHVFPSAGPPCFLDDDLFAVNDLDDDPANIFPDQPAFLAELARHGITTGHLVVPGSVVELSGAPAGGRAAVARCVVTHPRPEAEALAPFTDKRHYLDQYRSDWEEWLAAERAGWSTRPHDVVAELREWFTPLLDAAPITSAGIGGTVLLVLQDPAGGGPDEGVVIDFVGSEVRAWDGAEPAVYRVDVDRRLVEACIERHLEDWVNSLFLSCRFTAHREGPFNEYVMTFFKALSPDRIAYLERCYGAARQRDEWCVLDGWRMQRYCPHRQADLSRFGDVADGHLTCALHHWEWDLATGRCLTSDDPAKHLRAEPT